MIGVKDHNGEMIWMFPNEGSSSYESVYSDNEAYKGDQRRYAGFDIEVKDGKTIITSEKLVNIQKQGEGNFGLAAKGRIALVDNNPDPDADVIIDSIQGKAWINNPENVGINAPNYDFVDNQEYFTRKQEATHKTESGEELVGAGDDTSRTSESAQRVLDGTVEQRQTARESVQQPTSTARGIKKAVTQTDTGTRTTTAGSSNSNINNALDAGEHLLQLQTHRNIKPLTSIQDENYYYFEADGYTYAIEREALDSVTSARGGSTTATTNGAVLYNKQIREFQGTVYRKEGGEWVQRSQANEDGIQTLNQRQGVVQNLYVGTFDDSVVDFYRKTSAQTVIEPESNAPSIKPSSFWINQREYNRNNWEWQGSYYYDNTNREYLRYRSGRLQIYDQTGESWIDRQDDRSYFNPSLDNRPQRDDDSGSGGGSGSSRNNPIS